MSQEDRYPNLRQAFYVLAFIIAMSFILSWFAVKEQSTIITNKDGCCSMTITHLVLDEYPNTYDIVYYDYITGEVSETREFLVVDKDYIVNMFKEYCDNHHVNHKP